MAKLIFGQPPPRQKRTNPLTLINWVKVFFEKPSLSIPIEIHSDSHQPGSHRSEAVYVFIGDFRIVFPDDSIWAIRELIEEMADALTLDFADHGEKGNGDKRVQFLEVRNEKRCNPTRRTISVGELQ